MSTTTKPTRRQTRPNIIEAAILGNRRQTAQRPPPRRAAPSIIRRIVATIRRERA